MFKDVIALSSCGHPGRRHANNMSGEHWTLIASLLLQAAPSTTAAQCAAAQGDPSLSALAKGRSCAPLGPTRKFKGVFVDQFEGQTFLEGASNLSDLNQRRPRAWLIINISSAERQRFHMAGSACGYAYRLRFDGAATPIQANPAQFRGYGHMGLWPQLIVVSRLRSARLLGEVHRNCRDPFIYPRGPSAIRQ